MRRSSFDIATVLALGRVGAGLISSVSTGGGVVVNHRLSASCPDIEPAVRWAEPFDSLFKVRHQCGRVSSQATIDDITFQSCFFAGVVNTLLP